MSDATTTPDADGSSDTDGPTVTTEAARDLLRDLVGIPSPSGEEAAAAERLIAFFEAHDREAWRDDAGNVRAPADDGALLASHVDTVPGDIPVRVEEMDDEAAGSETGDEAEGPVLWGRGSVDATGALAAMAAAAVRTGVSFAGVAREETDSAGAKHLIEDRAPPEAVVNGEPSGWDGITLGYRGLLTGTYVATSESGHTSRPEPNAIQDALRWWGRIEDAFGPSEGGGEWTPAFERVTPKPVRVDGGPTDDGLAVEASLRGEFRIPPGRSPGGVREIADDALGAGTVAWDEAIPPVMASPRSPVASALRAAIRTEGGEPTMLRKTGTSDMNLYSAWGVPMATYGPGDSAFDHAPDERLPLREFDRSLAVLTRVAERLRGVDDE
jgi:LysW-gamma-L-lysine carboxypeptidase